MGDAKHRHDISDKAWAILVVHPLQNERIKGTKSDSGIGRGKTPNDGAHSGIMAVIPSGKFRSQQFDVGNSAIQALSGQSAQIAFGDIEPTAMLWGVMDF